MDEVRMLASKETNEQDGKQESTSHEGGSQTRTQHARIQKTNALTQPEEDGVLKGLLFMSNLATWCD